MAYDASFWQRYLTGGAAARSDSISGLNPDYQSVIQRMIQGAPPDIANQLRIMSAYRSPATQQPLWDAALKKYGSPEAARKWVAPPGHSEHGAGDAIDWQYGSPAAREWAHAHAADYGATFPLANEPWHMELAGARGSGGPVGAGLSAAPVSAAPVSAAPPVPGVSLSGAGGAAGGVGGGLSSAISAIASGLGGKPTQDPTANQILPSNLDSPVTSGDNNAATAGALMASLMADRRQRYGLSLTGMSDGSL